MILRGQQTKEKMAKSEVDIHWEKKKGILMVNWRFEIVEFHKKAKKKIMSALINLYSDNKIWLILVLFWAT